MTARDLITDVVSNYRGLEMRSDMVPGAVFPDYELSDHAASSPSCKDRIRWFSYSAAEVSVPRTAAG